MSEKKYKHNCDKCKFLFHHGGFDVYRSCSTYESYLFRFDNPPEDYISYPLDILLKSFANKMWRVKNN